MRARPGASLGRAWRPIEVRPLAAADVPGLADLFLGSFRQIQPFGSPDNDAARTAAGACLAKTAAVAAGPLIEPACFTVWEDRGGEHVAGTIFVTLVPHAARTEPFWRVWKESPPGAVADRLGVPHLTWVFVHPWETRHGIGLALLAAAVDALRGWGSRTS